MKLTLEQAEALARIRTSPEGKILLNLLGAKAEEMTRTLILSDTVSVDLARGELRAYTQIFDAFQKAPDTIEKYNHQT